MSAPTKPNPTSSEDFDLERLPDWLLTSINHVNDAILITEAEPFNAPGPKILWANAAFYRNTGYAPQEVLGQNPRILQGPLTDRSMLDRVRAALEAWQSFRGEVLNYRKDGTTYWNEFEIVPVANKDGWYTHWVSVQRDVTERKRTQEALQQSRIALQASHDLLGKLSRNVPGTIYQFQQFPDGHSCFPFASESIGDVYEVTPAQVRENADAVLGRLHPDDLDAVVAAIGESARTLQVWRQEYRVNLPQQGLRWLLGMAQPERLNDGSTLWHGFITDITERKHAQATLEEFNRNFESFLNQTSDFVYFKDRQSRFRFCSQTMADITGHAHWHDMIGKHDSEVFPADTAKIYEEEEAPIFSPGTPLLNKIDPYYSADGSPGFVETNKWPLIDKEGQIVGLFGISRDITDRKQVEEQILHLAQHDALTGLANRALFTDRLQRELASARRDQTSLALLFIDLDKFKPVNDQHGHAVGDLLLKEVAQRMQACVRDSDTLARIGGDEFVVLLRDVAGESEALAVAEKIWASLERPFVLAGHSLGIGCCVGVALYPQHGGDDLTLTNNADHAMYLAKERGRNQVVLFRSA